jgi:hypothetical protein
MQQREKEVNKKQVFLREKKKKTDIFKKKKIFFLCQFSLNKIINFFYLSINNLKNTLTRRI